MSCCISQTFKYKFAVQLLHMLSSDLVDICYTQQFNHLLKRVTNISFWSFFLPLLPLNTDPVHPEDSIGGVRTTS